VHQIINPLNGVIGTVDNLIDGTIHEDRKDQRLRAVRAQLEWAVVLVRNLAFFTQTALLPEGTKGPSTSRACVIPQTAIEALQFFQEAGVSRGISIELTDRRTQYSVKGSPDLLRQVFMNLIDNAVKYSDPNTTIKITPRVQRKTNNLLVEVENIGVGFSNDETPRSLSENRCSS
jgi:signal transduction histidine kinase